jgi:DNA-directed RNA polymerase alpha subunit
MKKQKILEKTVEELGLDKKIVTVLKENDIKHIEDLWKLKRKDLKEFKFSDSEITSITIKLQLFGLDLNKKVY